MKSSPNKTFRQSIGLDAPAARTESATSQVPSEPLAAPSNPTLRSPESWRRISESIRLHRAVDRRLQACFGSSTPAIGLSLVGKPAGTLAVCPDGSYIGTPQKPFPDFSDLSEFHVFDRCGTFVGKIDVKIIDSPAEDCSALTWVDKGDVEQKNIKDFVMWQVSSRAPHPHVEIRNLLNQGLADYFWKQYEMVESGEADLRGDSNVLQARARHILEQEGWILADR